MIDPEQNGSSGRSDVEKNTSDLYISFSLFTCNPFIIFKLLLLRLSIPQLSKNTNVKKKN
jgi:hypothetical protein